MSVEFVSLVVGGHPYRIFKSDIDKFAQSFFSNLAVGDHALVLERDGVLFRHINAFLVVGKIANELTSPSQRTVLEALREEARFFALPDLESECNKALYGDMKLSYITLDAFLKSLRHHGQGEQAIKIDRKKSKLTTALRWDLAAPFTCGGTASGPALDLLLFRTSTVANPVLPELIAAATQSAFGKGTETITDVKVRESLEIRADKLNQDTLTTLAKNFNISALWPRRNYQLRPYKLVIYQPGGHFDQHRDTVRGEGHIGTLVLILNSAYTGGKLEITHAGRTEVVTGPYRWVAMYGDCLHKICPVTSGTRVSLIYDIYGHVYVNGQGYTFAPAAAGVKRSAADMEGTSADADFELPTPAAESSADGNSDSDGSDDHDNDLLLTDQISSCAPPPATANIPRVMQKALDKELRKYDKVVICLSHMYPAHQTVPGFLKGNDQVLYDLLKDHYRVQVVYCRIHRMTDYWGNIDCDMGNVFVTYGEEYARFTATAPPPPPDDEGADYIDQGVPRLPRGKTKIVIPRGLDRKCLMKYRPYAEHTGNEALEGEAVYVVAGLQIMCRT